MNKTCLLWYNKVCRTTWSIQSDLIKNTKENLHEIFKHVPDIGDQQSQGYVDFHNAIIIIHSYDVIVSSLEDKSSSGLLQPDDDEADKWQKGTGLSILRIYNCTDKKITSLSFRHLKKFTLDFLSIPKHRVNWRRRKNSYNINELLLLRSNTQALLTHDGTK